MIIPAALPCLLALRPGTPRAVRLIGAWLALDIVCALVKASARESGAIALERAAWTLPGVALACVAVELHARPRAHALPLLCAVVTFALATLRDSAWWLVAGLGCQALIGTWFVLRHLARRRRLDVQRTALLALLALDLATCLTCWIVGIRAAWPAVADLRLTAHGILCIGLVLRPSRD